MNSRSGISPKTSTTAFVAGHTPSEWLDALSHDAPCGVDLEYDPAYVVLSAKTTLQPDVQYGNFIGAPQPVDWHEIERECRGLMIRSRDIRLAIMFARSRTRLGGGDGLAQGLSLLAHWLDRFPDSIHPQADVDTQRDDALPIRGNALAALVDTDGLLGDLRAIVLVGTSTTRLLVRDVERAFARPRRADSLTPEAMERQLDELRARTPERLGGFDRALASFGLIASWSNTHLENFAPDLEAMGQLLRRLAQSAGQANRATPVRAGPTANASVESTTEANGAATPQTYPRTGAETMREPGTTATQSQTDRPCIIETTALHADRQTALGRMIEARHWFEAHEPSSPVPLLLKRAEQLVGRRYSEIVQAIPAELLLQWESEL